MTEHNLEGRVPYFDDGFLIAVQEDSAHKNKYFFALRKQGIDPSIVSRPPIKKGRYYGKVIT